jgi:hypothetical protein
MAHSEEQQYYGVEHIMEKIWHVIVPNLTGIGLIVAGWFLSISTTGGASGLYIGSVKMITAGTFIGLIMILVGAFLPRIWNKIRTK